jgi:5-methylcytosine-specific restriction enzyme A
MNAASADQFCGLILRKLGLQLGGRVADGQLTLSPSAHAPNESFSIRFHPGWRSAEAALSPGTFAGPMVRSMGEASEDAKLLFCGYVAALRKEGVHVEMRINGSTVDAANHTSWPDLWTSFDVSLRKSALVFDLNNDAELMPVADLLLTPLVGMAMALIGTEGEDALEGDVEGTPVQYLATRYERKKLNREACIRIHGSVCAACGFNFGKVYGDLADGYIEVHHIESLALSGPVRIDPATDLVPLCSNCHSVVHRVSPPLPIAELVRLISEGRQKCSGA